MQFFDAKVSRIGIVSTHCLQVFEILNEMNRFYLAHDLKILNSFPAYVSRCRYANPTDCRLPAVGSGKVSFGFTILPGVITPGCIMNPLRGKGNVENLKVASISIHVRFLLGI